MAASREYDFVVFGASGFTGKYVVDELFKNNYHKDFRIAVAGRDKAKLKAVLTWVEARQDLKSVEDTAIIEADTSDYQSLVTMCKKAYAVLNCVGPYRFYGEPVVKACIEGGSDYLDITGEPEFMERIRAKYYDAAVEKGVYIILACGFDCVPSELGMVYAKENFHGTLGSVENYFLMTEGENGMTGNYGTYSSLVNSISGASSLRSARRSQASKRIPICGPKLSLKYVHYDKDEEKYALAFLGADVSVVKRSQRFFYDQRKEIPTQFAMYFCTNFTRMVLTILFLLVLKFMTTFSWGTQMLLKHPRFFSGGSFSRTGPTDKQIEDAGFRFTMRCKGYERALEADEESTAPYDSEMVVGVHGPEIGYALTPIALVQASCCVVTEKESLPGRGGVFTPGPAFRDTSLIKRLCKHGVSFKILKNQKRIQHD